MRRAGWPTPFEKGVTHSRIVEKRFGRDIGKQDETLQIKERASKMWRRRIKKD